MIISREKIVEIRAGGGNKESITYLLTSVSRELRDRFEKEGHRGVNVSLTIQDSIIYKSSIPLNGKNLPEGVKSLNAAGPHASISDTWAREEVLETEPSTRRPSTGRDGNEWGPDGIVLTDAERKRPGDRDDFVPNY